jgi:hypothetical protein
MNKCKCKCTCIKDEPFNEMMNRVLRESGERLKKEMGFGIPDKARDKIKFDKPKIFKGELDHVKRSS